MAYVGQGIKGGTFSVLDTSGNTYNGSNVTFNLGTQVSSPAQLLVSHDGVIQKPVTDYTIATGGTQITFTTAPASGASIFITEISGAVGAPMNRDINGDELILDADADTSITADTDDQIDIRIAGADDFQFTANTFTAQSGSTIAGQAITATSLDLGDGNIANVGTVAADRVLGDADADTYIDFPGSDIVTINTGDNIRFRIDDSGKLSSGGETAPDVSKGGIALNQAQFDTAILTFKSSDIAHGNTGQAEADTYGMFDKYKAGQGGLFMEGFSEDNESGLHIKGYITGAANEGEAGNQYGVMEFNAVINSGTGTTTPAADGNAFTFECDGDVEFIIKGDGELFSNQSATVGTYDTYEDAQLIRAYDLSRGENVKGLINSKFDKFVQYNQKDLADAKLIGKDENGNPTSFVNITGMQRLHNGAIWQQYEKHNRLLEAVYDLAKEAVGKEKANAILDKHEVKRLQ